MNELKPCPWCGEVPNLEPEGDEFDFCYVSCLNESCEMEPMLSRDTIEKAIAAWNNRKGEGE